MATKKGEYPITVGTGFSLAEIIFSRENIYYTGIETPDVMFILSEDGYKKAGNRIGKDTLLVVDSKLNISLDNETITGNFREIAGKKGAALCAIAAWLNHQKMIPPEALIEAAQVHKHSGKLLLAIKSVG